MLSRKEAHRLIERVLSYSKLPDCQVTIGEVDLAQTRFAENSITTSGRSTSAAITIASTMDRRTGTMLVNETSSEALRQAVAQSEALARFAPVDPEYVGPLGAQDYPAIAGYDEATGRAAQKEMLGTVKSAIGDAQARQLSASGYFERVASTLAVGNKRGNFGYAQRTRAEY